MNLVQLPYYCTTFAVVEYLIVPGGTASAPAAAVPGGGGGAAAAAVPGGGGGAAAAAAVPGGGGGAAAAAAAVPGGGGAAAAAGGQNAPSRSEPVLTLDAQRTIHNLLQAADMVFSMRSAFNTVHPGTFLVELGSGMVVVSVQGIQETVQFVDFHQWVAQVDANLRSMASCIRSWMFPTQQTVPVIEVEQGLLQMMEHEGWRMWDAIRYHPSLVPLVNRPDFLLRIHDHLVNVVVCTNLNGYWAVLGMLQVNGQWHAVVNSNMHLAAFYGGSFYNSTDQTPQVQAFQLLRYHRNPSAHGLEHAVPPGPVEPSTVPQAPLPAAAMPRGFVPRVAAQQGETPVQPRFARCSTPSGHCSSIISNVLCT